MESKTENDINTLTTSQDIKKKAREELDKQLQGLLNNEPIENPTDDNIEDEVNRLMKEVDQYEKNYVPKEIDINAFNDLKKFEEEFEEEEFEEPENEEEEKEEKEEIPKLNNIKEINRETKDKSLKKEQKNQINKKKSDLNLKNEDLEDKKKYNKNKNNKNNIMQDKEIKELLNEYERQLNIEVEREVEKEYKPKLDENDIKRADILLKKDPLINEALIQGMITKEELILFIDYYEIFSLTNNAKKITNEHLKALDDLCLKKKDTEKEDKLNEINKNNVYDLNDEDAINKLTKEIEKKMESSEKIFNRKLDYEKIMRNKNIDENIKKDFFKNMNKEKEVNINEDKNSNNNKVNDNKNNINEEDRRLPISKSEISTFTTEELMSVPKYIYKNNKKENNNSNINTNSNSNNSINSKKNNAIFHENTQISQSSNNNIDNEIYKPKTPLNPISKDKNKNKNNSNNNSMLSYNTGKKTIPPIKNNNLKAKSNKRVDLYDDDGNPIIIGKNKDSRKELIKMKMGGKSRMHELFTNKPRNIEENEKLRQKFIDFIQNGKEINKNNEPNTVKKSIVRKKIEDAQMFNKYKK